jgi:hypothetical protein
MDFANPQMLMDMDEVTIAASSKTGNGRVMGKNGG